MPLKIFLKTLNKLFKSSNQLELNKITALIPILNVSLATKEMLSGSINWILLSEVYASLIVLAGFSLWFCVKWFNREETIFRN